MVRRVRSWRRAPFVSLVALLVWGALALTEVSATFRATTVNGTNQFTAAGTFPTYPTSVTTDSAWAYHRGEEAMSGAATSAAADSSGNNRHGTYAGKTDGPTLWWRMRERSGSTLADSSGVGNMGTLMNGATLSTGPGGGGAVTSGGGFGPAVQSPASEAIRPDQSFTLSIWTYMTGTTVHQRGVANMTKQSPVTNPRSDLMVMFVPNSGNHRWAFAMAEDPTSDTNTAFDWLVGTTPAVQNTWTHLTAVYDTSVAGGTMYLYVNGVLESSMPHTPLNNTTSGLKLELGRYRNGSFSVAYNGSFGEVRAYKRALNSTEVGDLAGTLPEEKWNFSESSGSTTADSGIHGNTGTLGSATSFVAGHSGNAVSMNGDGNGYVEAATKGVETDRSFSVAAWANLNSLGAGVARAIVSEPGVVSSPFILKYDTSGRWAFTLPTSDAVAPMIDQILSMGAAATDTWVHVAGVYDDAANTVELYVNGASQGAVAHADVDEWNGTGRLQIGRTWWNGAYADAWHGKIDTVRVYQRALTAGEVTGLAAGTDPAAPFTEAAMTARVPGALQGTQQALQASTAVAFAGLGNAHNNTQVAAPGPTEFTVECWFTTRSTTGGQLIAYTDDQTGASSLQRDRMVYLDSGNRLTFGIWWNNGARTVRSPGSYNDGAWHHAAASYGPAGLKLYVDGVVVASDASYIPAANPAGAFAGYWRWGGGRTGSWPDSPATTYFTGTLDELAVFHSQLSDQQIAWHYHANH